MDANGSRPTRAQQRAAGTNKTVLFDIVNRDDGQRSALRAPRFRTRPTLVSRASPRVRATRGPRVNSTRPGTWGRHDGSKPAGLLRFAILALDPGSRSVRLRLAARGRDTRAVHPPHSGSSTQ